LLRRYFKDYEDRRGKWRNVRYTKNLHKQAALIECLDLLSLMEQFEDVAQLVNWMEAQHPHARP
jgi:hypothetical protein